MRITVVGHSTVLIEAANHRVLTDPFFGTRGNPAYRRIMPPGLTREDFLDVDLALVSHNHWDHTDRRYFRSLSPDVPVLAPARASWVTRLKGARNTMAMRPWQERAFEGLTVTAVPALHPSTTVGYVIRAEGREVYFAGDTYYRPFIKRIGERFRLDVALLPVTTYRIPMTMGEKGAVKAVRDLGVPVVIPIHLAIEPRSPLLRTRHSTDGFTRRLAEAGLKAQVVVLAPGERWTVPSPARTTAASSPREA